MFNISSREKRMIILMVSFISIVILYKYFFVPYLDKWKSTTAQILAMETRLTHAKQLKANPTLAAYSQETIQNQTAAIANLLEKMESWSEEAGVTMTSVRPGPVQNRGNNSELFYDVEVAGDLRTLCRFIDAIEQPGVIARINKIRISKPKDILKDITAVITVSTLSLPESAPRKLIREKASEDNEL